MNRVIRNERRLKCWMKGKVEPMFHRTFRHYRSDWIGGIQINPITVPLCGSYRIPRMCASEILGWPNSHHRLWVLTDRRWPKLRDKTTKYFTQGNEGLLYKENTIYRTMKLKKLCENRRKGWARNILSNSKIKTLSRTKVPFRRVRYNNWKLEKQKTKKKKRKVKVVRHRLCWESEKLNSTVKGRSLTSIHLTWTVRNQSENTLSAGSRPTFQLIRLGSDIRGLSSTSFNF